MAQVPICLIYNFKFGVIEIFLFFSIVLLNILINTQKKSVVSFGGFEPSNWNGSPMFYTLFLRCSNLSMMHYHNNKMRYLNAICDFGHEITNKHIPGNLIKGYKSMFC